MSSDPTPVPIVAVPVLIVGGGPAGLAAAAVLAAHTDVLVLEREAHAGGIPRHSEHSGYGLRDLHRLMRGPAYAARLVAAATAAGAGIRTASTVTGWQNDLLAVTSPQGRYLVRADAVVLATGARERARAARLVPGDRPAGVYTTGELQNLVHLQGGVPGRRAVVVGAELVSWSAVLTLRHAGCRTVLMVSEHDRAESYAALTRSGRLLGRVPLATGARIAAVHGRGRVSAVDVLDATTGASRRVDCDTVVFTGSWIPDAELARAGGLELDPGSLGPLVDADLASTRAGIFAAGNLVHPVDTADVAALGGRQVARTVLAYLNGDAAPSEHTGEHGGEHAGKRSGQAVRIRTTAPIRWVSPGLIRPGTHAPARHRLLLAVSRHVGGAPRLTAVQGGRQVGTVRTPWPASPGRVFRVPSSLLRDVDPDAGDVQLFLAGR